jgi:hypothetical protein
MADQLLTLNQVMDYNLRYLLGTRCNTSATLAPGSTASRIDIDTDTTASVSYSIAGQMYTKAATANIQWGTAATSGVELDTMAVLEDRWYCVSLDSGGNLKVTQGEDGGGRPDPYTSTTTGTFDTCVIGYIHVVLANAATFDPGTTNFNATDVTTTFVNAAIPF